MRAVPTTPSLVVLTLAIGPHGLSSGPAAPSVRRGVDVVLRITSSLPGELTLLVGGYDVRGELDGADGQSQVSFTADRAGAFPLTVEETGSRVAILHVR